MTYGSTLLATDFRPYGWQVRLWRAFLFFIPRASPEHERLYCHVRKWYLELDDSGVPVREIGLDVDGRPLFGAPDDRNFGFWTDSSDSFERDKLTAIPADEFERLWREVQRRRDGRA